MVTLEVEKFIIVRMNEDEAHDLMADLSRIQQKAPSTVHLQQLISAVVPQRE